MDRIHFKNLEDCYNFFNECRVNHNSKSWKDLAKFIGTSRSVIDNYRKGVWCMPENRFLVLLNLIHNDKKELFLRSVERRNENWGRIIGGKKAYIINKHMFDIGRKKAHLVKKRKMLYKFDINMPLSEELCEFIGVIIGDGFTNKYNCICQIQVVGDKKLDLEYYHNRLKSICEKIFSITPKIIEKRNCVVLNIYSRTLFEMLTKRFEIPAGKKCYSVIIPTEIINSDKKFINATLKGMFNTDGGVGFDKRTSYKKPYLRINYSSASKFLIEQIHNILIKYLINHSIHKNGNVQQIQINGESNSKKFISEIGFSNNRHLDKIKYLL